MYEEGGSTLDRKVALFHFLLLAGGLLLYNNEKTQGFTYNMDLSPPALMARGSQPAGPIRSHFNTTAAVLLSH